MSVSQTVYVNIVVRGGMPATSVGEDKDKDPTKPMRTGMDLTAKAANFLVRTILTLQKALISMVGVMIAWAAFITLPEAIISGIAKVLAAVVKYGEEVNKTILSTAGLLSSFASFGNTAEQSFNNAVIMSRRLQFTFAELASQSLATAQDIQKGFQIFVARGGLQFTGGDLDKAARTTGFLVNLNIALNGEYQKERQIVTEIGAVMEGQARVGAMIARLLKAQVGDLRTYLDARRREGNLLEDLEKRFGGINVAAARLGQTLSGMITSISGMAQIVNGMAYQNGAFPVIGGILVKWRDLLINVVKELGTVREVGQQLTPETESVLKAFAMLNVALEQTAYTLQFLLNIFVSTEGATAIENIAQAILKIVLYIDAAVTEIAILIKQISSGVTPGGALLTLFTMVPAPEKIDARIKEIVDNIKKALAEGEGKNLLQGLLGGPAETDAALKATEKIKDFIEKTNDQIAILGARTDQVKIVEIKRAAIIREQADNLALVSKELRQQAIDTNFLAEVAEKVVAWREEEYKRMNQLKAATEEADQIADAQLKKLLQTLEALEDWVIKYNDIKQQGIAFEATQADIDAMIKKANEDFKEQAELLAKVLGYIHEIDVIAQYNRGFHQYISDVQDTVDITQTLVSQVREAEISYRAADIGVRDLADAINVLKIQLADNDVVLMGLNAALATASKDEIPILLNAIRALASANRQATRDTVALSDAYNITNMVIDRASSSMQKLLRGEIGMWQTFTNVVQGAAVMIGQGMGDAFTQMAVAIRNGESALASFGAFIGSILIQMGNMAVSLGTISLLGSLIPALGPLFNPGAAAALIAAGAAAIALGVMMGGAGEKTSPKQEAATTSSGQNPSYSISQRDVMVQQGMINAMNANTTAVNTLNGELGRLSKERGDVLVQNAVKRNPNAIIAPIQSKFGNSFSAAAGFGSAILQT